MLIKSIFFSFFCPCLFADHIGTFITSASKEICCTQSDTNNGSLVVLNGSITNNSKACFNAEAVDLYQGHLFNKNGASFAACLQDYLTIHGSHYSIVNDKHSTLGPFQLNMLGGSIANDGLLFLDHILDEETWQRGSATSYLIDGKITGNGQTWIAGDAFTYIDVEQKLITIGKGLEKPFFVNSVPVPGVLHLKDVNLSAPVAINNQGMLKGLGQVTIDGYVYGKIYPTGLDPSSIGTIRVRDSLAFKGEQSGIVINIDGTVASIIKVHGNVDFDAGTTLTIENVTNPPRGPYQYIICSADYFGGPLPKIINHTAYQDIFSISIVDGQLITDAIINSEFPKHIACPCQLVPNPNVCEMVKVLNTIDRKCPRDTQIIIDEIIIKPPLVQMQMVSELISVFKKAQYVQEKLDLQIHKEIDGLLQHNTEGFQPFVFAGYNEMKQKPKPYFTGYQSKTFYEFLGGIYDNRQITALAGIGFSQTHMQIIPHFAKASINSYYLTGAFAYSLNKWTFGLDLLLSKGYLNGERSINFLNFTAKNKHNLWNASCYGKINYQLFKKALSCNLYEEFGYDIGKESPYQEYGAPGAALYIKKERIDVIRNGLGLNFFTPRNKLFSFTLDAAWVLDCYINHQSYRAAFLQTQTFGKFIDVRPSTNFARLEAVVSANLKKVNINASVFSLAGKKFRENAVNLNCIFNF